ncbi:LAMI_0C02872g1_1 [Lachancea mirantina]|uniref:LAMI_0C02872g1_1 n=1 Tax=Lachancea mirantina TaxID=1230905 RepID=A0A1G4J1R7_9SACH|nr:LAMI_0C02872g1_1 [Lachancea mirantina]
MAYLTPPVSLIGINQPNTPPNGVLETPTQPISSSSNGVAQPFRNFESDMSLKLKNNICKSFEDDLFFCPRTLLSSQELSTCQQMDLLMLKQLQELSSMGSSSGAAILEQQLQGHPKFNPYTSQSFSPAPPVLESQ